MRIDPQRFGQALKRIRRIRGVTQPVLAEQSQLTVNYISLVENGERMVSIDAMNRLAESLEIPARFLSFLGGSGEDGEFLELSRSTEEAIWAAIEMA
jgi:transcriptional regulator with XRE-family HTH domain